MTLLAIDVGTTHCKAALFDPGGAHLGVASRPMAAERPADGNHAHYDPEGLWQTVAGVVAEVTAHAGWPAIAAIGVASMAETGLLLDRRTREPRSPLLPWFDTAAAPFAELIERQAPASERFRTFGIYPSFKCSLAKILWWRNRSSDTLAGAVWLSVADYVTYRLCGALATDHSLAGRTYAFDLGRRAWAGGWLRGLGLDADLFPEARPAVEVVGKTGTDLGALGLAAGIPVVNAGHDHVCAAFGAGVAPGEGVFDSMGTAEVLLGAIDPRPLGEAEQASGLSFGAMPDGRAMYWLGGLSSSGGALEWLRGILGDPPVSYDVIERLQGQMDEQPGAIIFLPYLAGSGAPRPDPALRGAFVGLDARHGRGDVLKAVLEGTAFQIEAIRRAAVSLTGGPIGHLVAAGGGTRNRRWLQIKADVHGARIDALDGAEATLVGAALIAGVGGGIYAGEAEARTVARSLPSTQFKPNPHRHPAYARLFDEFWALQARLHQRRPV